MGEFETAAAAPFIHMHISALSQMKLIFYYTQDKRWMGIDDAKKLIAQALARGCYLKNEKDEFILSDALKSEKIPLGFKPTDAIFAEEDIPEINPIESIFNAVVKKTGKDRKTLSAEMNEIRKKFDNLIADDAAVVILAKRYAVDVSPYCAELLRELEGR
ncbi:MAG TPA: DUF2240 family protein [Methanocorpusculum sp.]|nr:DUF2240 family protein [Methanocorpusculum sp.]